MHVACVCVMRVLLVCIYMYVACVCACVLLVCVCACDDSVHVAVFEHACVSGDGVTNIMISVSNLRLSSGCMWSLCLCSVSSAMNMLVYVCSVVYYHKQDGSVCLH